MPIIPSSFPILKQQKNSPTANYPFCLYPPQPLTAPSFQPLNLDRKTIIPISHTAPFNQAVFYAKHPFSHNKPHQNPKFSMKPNLKIIEMFHVKHCPIIYNNHQSKLHITPPNPIVSYNTSQHTLPKFLTSPFPPPHTHRLWQKLLFAVGQPPAYIRPKISKPLNNHPKHRENTIKPPKP